MEQEVTQATLVTYASVADMQLKGVHSPPLIDSRSPIGLFDSGVGGLSIYLHLRQVLPNERYIYYADTLNVPYGKRSSQDICKLTLTAVTCLVNAGCKVVVIACNSASAHALYAARQQFPDTLIVGLVPAVKPAVLASKTNHVAVLATQATLQGVLLNRVIETVAVPNQVTVTKWFDPDLVPWVESGMPADSYVANNLKQQLQLFYQAGIDQLVLGCTHYPFFQDFILAEIAQKKWDMGVVESGRAIAARVHYLLVTNQLLNTSTDANDAPTSLLFFATKHDTQLSQVVQQLVHREMPIKLC